MSKSPNLIEHSKKVLRRSSWWIFGGVFSLVATFGITYIIVEQIKELVYDAEHTRDFVSSLFASPLSAKEREDIINSYTHTKRQKELDGLDILLVLNDRGIIEASSVPSWVGLPISDQRFRLNQDMSQTISSLSSCFAVSGFSCFPNQDKRNEYLYPDLTVVHAFRVPARDLGEASPEYAILSSYNSVYISSRILETCILVLFASALIASVTAVVFFYIFEKGIYPSLLSEANTDSLTGLLSRDAFMAKAKRALVDSEIEQVPKILALFDVDNFRAINDAYGHECGDLCLAYISGIVGSVMRSSDLTCRFGGEEFALLLSGAKADVTGALERLRMQIDMSQFEFASHRVKLSISIGAVSTLDFGYNLNFLCNKADKALYEAKQEGKNIIKWSVSQSISRLSN